MLIISEYATKTELNGKANSSHKHTMADITDLEIPEIDTSNFASKDHTHESLTSTDGDFSITVDTKRILINYADNQIRITGSFIDISNDNHCLSIGSNYIMWCQYSAIQDQINISFKSSGVYINGRKILTETFTPFMLRVKVSCLMLKSCPCSLSAFVSNCSFKTYSETSHTHIFPFTRLRLSGNLLC